MIFADASDCVVGALSGVWSDISTVSTGRGLGFPSCCFDASEFVELTGGLARIVAWSFEGRRVQFGLCFGKVIAINGIGFPLSVSWTSFSCVLCLAELLLSASYVNLTVMFTLLHGFSCPWVSFGGFVCCCGGSLAVS